jgi:outer membrane immunogenic protein
MNRILLVAATFIGANFTSPTIAADLPVKAPAPIVAAPFSWNGCYGGGSVGYNRHKVFWTDEGSWFDTSDQERKMSGWIFGLDGGCDYQTGSLVVGAVADISYSTAHKKTGWGTTQTVVDMHANWISTARLRAGLAFDRTLLYATGGIALSNSDTIWRDPSATWRWDDWNYGWAYGIGIEHVLQDPRYSVFLEALWLRFKKYRADNDPLFDSYPIDVRYRDLIVRIGLNYRFATGKTPAAVATRY